MHASEPADEYGDCKPSDLDCIPGDDQHDEVQPARRTRCHGFRHDLHRDQEDARQGEQLRHGAHSWTRRSHSSDEDVRRGAEQQVSVREGNHHNYWHCEQQDHGIAFLTGQPQA